MIELRVSAGVEAAGALARIKLLAADYPGEHELAILVGERRLQLGPLWRYSGSRACLAALSQFGEVVAP